MPIPLPPDERQKRQFTLAGNTPTAWLMSAESLLAGARILVSHHQAAISRDFDAELIDDEKVLPPAWLLYGFAVECLLKGVWVKQGNCLVENDRYIGIPGCKGHDLDPIASKVQFETDTREKQVLRRLGIQLVSSARYPIGKTWSVGRIERRDNGYFDSDKAFHSADIPIIEGIVTRLLKLLGFAEA